MWYLVSISSHSMLLLHLVHEGHVLLLGFLTGHALLAVPCLPLGTALDVDGTGLLNVDVPAGGLLVQSVHLLQLLVGERLVDLGLDGGGGLLELLVHAAAVVRSLCWAVRGLECGSRISCHQSPAS